MKKMNCWEYMKCGRETGGRFEHEYGPCPASTEEIFDGLYSGYNGGRSCWLVACTIRDGIVRKNLYAKREACRRCAFFSHVLETEYPDWELDNVLKNEL